MANAVVRYAAVAASGTLSILLAAGCDGSHTSYSHPTSTDYELSFDETHPAAESMNDVVHIYASTDSDGSVVKMYSVTLAVNGAPLYESMWHSQMGNSESLHDWVDCTASTSEIYPAIPRTISDIETSVLGPLAPPRDAKVIKPSEWQVQAGLAVMTIDQLGVSIMERVVSIGEVGSTIPGTVISNPKLSKVGTIPTFLPTWNVCKPSPQLVRPAPGRRVKVRNTPRAGQTPGGDRG